VFGSPFFESAVLVVIAAVLVMPYWIVLAHRED
jgi:hypothetical protein